MIHLQSFSMDQRVTAFLQKALAKYQNLKGTSLNNCIVNSIDSHIVYSFFNAYSSKETVLFQLVSILISDLDEHAAVVVQGVDFEDFFKVKPKEAEELQFDVKTNPSDMHSHLVQVRVRNQNEEKGKSKFFHMYLEEQMIKEGESVWLSTIAARKTIQQTHWHPLFKEKFVALTADGFVTFSTDGEISEEHVESLKRLEIRQPVADFSFWRNGGKQEAYYLSALGESGKTYIIALEEEEMRLVQVLECINQLQLNWTTIKAFKVEYNKKNVLLVIKSGNIYKKNVKKSMFEVYVLTQDEKSQGFTEKMIVQGNGEDKVEGSKSDQDFQFPFDFFNSSLLYFHDGKIMRLNLSKWLDFLTTKESLKSYLFYPKDAQNENFVSFDKAESKFTLFKSGELVVLRHLHSSNSFSFTRTSTEILQFELEGNSITKKINKVLEDLSKELDKKSQPFQEPFAPEKIDPLTEEATDADVDNFLNQTDRFIRQSQRTIESEQDDIKTIMDQIKAKSKDLDFLKGQKAKIESWEERIRQNNERIQRLQQVNREEHKTEEDEKIEELTNMIDHVRSKPIDLNEEVKSACAKNIEAQISLIVQIERKYRQAEQEFNRLK